MRTRRITACLVVLALLSVAAETEGCGGPNAGNPAEQAQERDRERSGDLPGERDVMVVYWASKETPYHVTVTRKTFDGQIREVYNRRHEEPARQIEVDYRTDDQSVDVVVTKEDASEENVMTCALRRLHSEQPADENVGETPYEVVCVAFGLVGRNPEA